MMKLILCTAKRIDLVSVQPCYVGLPHLQPDPNNVSLSPSIFCMSSRDEARGFVVEIMGRV